MVSNADYSKPLSVQCVKCPACGTDIEYRNFMKCPNVVIKRYEEIISILKDRYGDVKINNGEAITEGETLLTVIKDLEHTYSYAFHDNDYDK